MMEPNGALVRLGGVTVANGSRQDGGRQPLELVVDNDVDGDDAAPGLDFRAFFAENHRPIAQALAMTLRDDTLANDAVAEGMTRAYERWAEVGHYANPAGWTYRVGLNWARSRRRKWVREIFKTDPPEGAMPPVSVEPELDAALAALPVEQRSVVVLRYLLDWSEFQTAEALDIAPGTVKSRLSRALQKLAVLLEEPPRRHTMTHDDELRSRIGRLAETHEVAPLTADEVIARQSAFAGRQRLLAVAAVLVLVLGVAGVIALVTGDDPDVDVAGTPDEDGIIVQGSGGSDGDPEEDDLPPGSDPIATPPPVATDDIVLPEGGARLRHHRRRRIRLARRLGRRVPQLRPGVRAGRRGVRGPGPRHPRPLPTRDHRGGRSRRRGHAGGADRGGDRGGSARRGDRDLLR